MVYFSGQNCVVKVIGDTKPEMYLAMLLEKHDLKRA